jgi:hypothetical protein
MSDEGTQSLQVRVNDSTGPRDRGWRAWLVWPVLAAILLVHGWQTIRLFPSWRSITSDEPLISVDHAIHLYHGSLGAKFLKEHGTSWGYDPFFMAGYPKTPVYDSSSGPAELFQLLAGGTYSPRAYKIGIALLVGLIPVVIGLATWAYGMKPAAITASVAWCVWYWWVGFPDVLVRTGLVAFVWASAVGVLLPALLVRWRKPNGTIWGMMALTAALGIQAHAVLPLLVIVPLAVAYAWFTVSGANDSGQPAQPLSWRWHAATWAALAVALTVTIFWWWPLLRFLPLKTASDLYMTYEGSGFALLLGYYLFQEGRVPLLMLLLGTCGMVRWWRSGQRLKLAVGCSQIAVLTVLTFFGSAWQVTRNLEPLRFQVSLGLAWTIAAGEGLCAVAVALDPRQLAGSRWAKLRWMAVATFAGLLLVLTVPKVWWWRSGFKADLRPPSTWEYCRARLKMARPLGVGLRPEMNELVNWLETNTDNSARILFEDQLRLLENLDPGAPESLHWTPLLPVLSGRQFVGGLYQTAFIPHQRAAFGDWRVAGRHIREWSPQEIRAFCDDYNIGWVVTWSRAGVRKFQQVREDPRQPLSTEFFSSLPFCERIATLPRATVHADENEYAIFRVQREPNYFAHGTGRLAKVEYNRIELADLVPDDGELVLRFHWQDGLISEPPVPLERANVPGDPVGFIRIKTAKSLDRLIILNGY